MAEEYTIHYNSFFRSCLKKYIAKVWLNKYHIKIDLTAPKILKSVLNTLNLFDFAKSFYIMPKNFMKYSSKCSCQQSSVSHQGQKNISF